MANTTNFGWETPDDTDLVKDGAAAIRTLGSSIDTTTKNLNPSTTLGDIEYRSATANTNTRLGIGTNGQLLTVSSGVPAWATIATGGMTELASGSLSGASVTLSSISGSYKNLQLVVRDYLPATDSTSLNMRINNETTQVYLGQETNATNLSFNANFWSVLSTQDDTVADGLAIVDLFDYANTSTRKVGRIVGNSTNATTATNVNVRVVTLHSNITAAITRIDLFTSTGNFTSGNYILYGVN
jgi:hypothetical protein